MVRMFFGKYQGKKTLEQIFFTDPGYIYWMVDKEIREDMRKFGQQGIRRFADLLRRAAHLRIPGICDWCKSGRPVSRMFLTGHISGGLGVVGFDCDECYPQGSSPTMAMKPSFYTPDAYRSYDKTGGRLLVEAIKFRYFGDTSYRITDKRADEFFDNPANFVNF
jgi:hypothetical protein